MSDENGLKLNDGWQKIEVTGIITIGFEAHLNADLEEADPKMVGEEIFQQLLEGDLVEVGPAISYRITGP